ncbi:MAG: hypothetical protein Q9208_005326 [Pyrenodesmia sp. 3 TL-2023]
MPSAVSHHAFPKTPQYRSKSTVQEPAGNSHANDLLSALIQGTKKPQNTASQRTSPSTSRNVAQNTASQRTSPNTSSNQHFTPSLAKTSSPFSKAQSGGQPTQMTEDSKGQKRKAPETLQSPHSRRLKADPQSQEATAHTHNAVPTAEQYPDLDPRLFELPKSTLHNSLHGFATLSSTTTALRSGNMLCRLTCSFKDGQEKVAAEAQSQTARVAEKIAYLHLAVKLRGHKSQLVPLRIDKIDHSTMEDQKDAKLDIYNYAARFDAIPQISEYAHRVQGKRIHEITVKLPEQNIHVSARHREKRAAEIAAALRFKEAAEKYQAAHGDQSLVIKDSTSLTTETSRKFFDFYKIQNPNAVITVDHPSAPQGNARSAQNVAQVLINGELVGQAVTMLTKQKAEDLAFLTAAIKIKKQEPALFPDFVRALATGNGEILKPVSPVNLTVNEDCQLIMREALLSARRARLPDTSEELGSEVEEESKPKHFRLRLLPRVAAQRDRHLQQNFDAFLQNFEFAELRLKKEQLPMNHYRTQVLDLVSHNPYSIVIGATGSGKTTQVPQIILEDAITRGHGSRCNVICTQPRRIAATSVARRVAVERGEKLQDSVGYQVRFDAKLPQPGGSVTYCTTGILLQQLQHQPDEVMDNVSHLVIDEVHERDILIDFLLILLKKTMTERLAAGKPTPKVVLMSATMNTELFASYFNTEVGGKSVGCPSLSVPGRTFPVKEKYLEDIHNELHQAHPQEARQLLLADQVTTDYLRGESEFARQNPGRQHSTVNSSRPDEFVIDWKSERKLNAEGEVITSTEKDDAVVPLGLVATTVAHILKTTDEGAILVFLPGLEEMIKVEDLLRMGPLGLDLGDVSKFRLYLLHSSIPGAQTEVFNEVPSGCRKVILSTNIAETSVTIPDVQHVVDTGKLREKQYDQVRRITQLKCTWISKSNSKQRAGRAGRVQNGNYYALFSAERYNTLRAVGLPEMLRTDLQDICLDIKAQAFNYPIRNFLAEALEPPSPKNVDASVLNLQALDALTAEEEITPLGRLLASLPVHPALGKMIILGVIFRCLDPMLVIGAAAGERNLFVTPPDKKSAAKEAKFGYVKGSASDHIGLLNAVRDLRELRDTQGEYAMRQYAHNNFIYSNGFKTIDNTVRQIEDILVEAGLIPYTPEDARRRSEYGDPSLNENSSKVPLIKALAIAGFHPNLAVSTGGMTHRTPGEAHTIIHPASVNAPARPQRNGRDDDSRSDNGPRKYGILYTYSAMSRSNDGNSIYLRDTTECTPLMAALFGGRLVRSNSKAHILEMGSWLPFFTKLDGDHKSGQQIAKTVLDFRQCLDRLLASAFRDLKGSRRSREGEERGAYLAENEVRSAFAEALVEVLDRDNDTATAGADGAKSVRGRWPQARTFGEWVGHIRK